MSLSLRELFPNPFEKTTIRPTLIKMFVDTYSECFKSPECQRELCWTDAQYESFVRHLLAIGEFGQVIIMITRYGDEVYVLDGQHRLEALRRFISGEMTIYEKGVAVNYKTLPIVEQREFKQNTAGSIREYFVDSYDSVLAETVYNSFNFAGVKN